MVIQYFENPILLGCDALTEHVVPKILKNQEALKSKQNLIEMSNRNISSRGKCDQCVQLTTLLPAFTNYLEIWEPQPPGIVFLFYRALTTMGNTCPTQHHIPLSLEPEEHHCKNMKSHIQYCLLHKFRWLAYCFLCSMRPWGVYTLLCIRSIFTFPSIMVDRTANYSIPK